MSVDEVSDWLAALGLSRYASNFRESEISMAVLPDLDHDILKELGVDVIGHRLTILKAARELDTHNSLSHTTSSDALAFRQERDVTNAERRQLTVMFCDLVGSTHLSRQLDPEELREVVRSYQHAVGTVVERFEGHIAQYLGDGLLVYFGYPLAHEDDALRAVYVGLGIPDAIEKLNTRLREQYSVSLSVRIGIHTGPVVVGEMGSGHRHENLAMGETPNVAASLQGLADPDCIVVSASTAQLLGRRFELKALDGQRVKGFDKPVEVFRVINERHAQSRFLVGHEVGSRELIGREREMTRINEHWARAIAGEGQFAVLTGEAGIGKSRIVSAFADNLADTEHLSLIYQCSPYHSGSPLYPVIQQLIISAGIDLADSPDKQLDRLESILEPYSMNVRGDTAVLGHLLGNSNAVSERYGQLNLKPRELREQTLQCLIAQLAERARQCPVLLILEDAHWIDPTTQELLDRLIAEISRHRILLLLTARPAYTHFSDSTAEQMTINRLTHEQIGSLVDDMSRGKSLPVELLARIAEKSDGVPLYVEEITKTVLESGQLTETDSGYEVESRFDQISIPSSLQDSLMARLDRMQPIKVVAQTAACIGREFTFSLISAVSQVGKTELDSALDQLVSAQVFVTGGAEGNVSYLFRHALLRDAAYDSLLIARRVAIHQELFTLLQAEPSTAPEILAYHATQAGNQKAAALHWERAGDQAAKRTALLEAIGFFEQARVCIAKLADGNTQRELDVLVKLVRASTFRYGWSHPDTVKLIDEQLALLEKLGDTPRWFAIRSEKWSVHYIGAQNQKGLEEAMLMCDLADRRNDRKYQLSAYRHRAVSKAMLGQFIEASKDFEKAFTFLDPVKADKPPADAIDPETGLRVYRALNLMNLGEGAKAWEMVDGLEEQARESGSIPTYVTALTHVSWLHLDSLTPGGMPINDRSLASSEKYDLKLYYSQALLRRAVHLGIEKRYEESVKQMQPALELANQMHNLIGNAGYWSWYAYCLAAIGRHDESDHAARKAMSVISKGGELWSESENLRLLAVREYWHLNRKDNILDELQRALGIAQNQGARLFELRIANSLARVLIDQSDRTKAIDLLSPITERFPSSGSELPDYIAAQETLKAT
jgi:class 3 adenylate cyclase/tetratricopeptide (TPR) repeat protein